MCQEEGISLDVLSKSKFFINVHQDRERPCKEMKSRWLGDFAERPVAVECGHDFCKAGEGNRL